MKTLLLIRHAKSDWKTRHSDHQRPLNLRGERDAPNMASRLIKRHCVPQLIVSSDARRAARTCELLMGEFVAAGNTVECLYEAALYHGNAQSIIATAEQLPDKYQTVAIIGHNPDISNALASISDQPHDLVTCAVAQCVFNVDSWQQISAQNLQEFILDTPKKPYLPLH